MLFWWPKPWELSLIVLGRSVGGPNCGSFCLIGQNSGSYRLYKPKTMGAIWSSGLKPFGGGQNHGSYRSKRSPRGQNHGSYRSKRSPRGHLDEAPMEMGLPKPFDVPLKKSKKYKVIFPRQNMVNFSTKLITFWQIA